MAFGSSGIRLLCRVGSKQGQKRRRWTKTSPAQIGHHSATLVLYLCEDYRRSERSFNDGRQDRHPGKSRDECTVSWARRISSIRRTCPLRPHARFTSSHSHSHPNSHPHPRLRAHGASLFDEHLRCAISGGGMAYDLSAEFRRSLLWQIRRLVMGRAHLSKLTCPSS